MSGSARPAIRLTCLRIPHQYKKVEVHFIYIYISKDCETVVMQLNYGRRIITSSCVKPLGLSRPQQDSG